MDYGSRMARAKRRVAVTACAGVLLAMAVSPASAVIRSDAGVVDPNAYQPASVVVGSAPKGIAVVGNFGLVANFDGQNATPFSACMPKSCAAQTAAAIPTGLQPSGVAAYVLNGRGTAYVTNSGSGSITIVPYEAGYGALTDPPITVSVGGQPTGIAISPRGDRAYIADNQRNLLQVMDTSSRAVIAAMSVPDGPWGVAVTPDGARIYVASTRANVVSVIDAATLVLNGTIPGQGAPANIAIDGNGSTGYITNNGSGSVSVLNIGTNEILGTIPVGSQPWGVLATPSAVFVANFGDGTVSVIEPKTRKVIATVRTGTQPFGIAQDLGRVFVTNSGSGTMSSIPLIAPTPTVSWSSNSEKRTITGKVRVAAGLAVTMIAKKGSTVRKGTCRRASGSSQVTCTVTATGGTWSASVQTRLPWQPIAGGAQDKRFTFS